MRYRERGNAALARLKWSVIPAYAGMTVRVGNDGTLARPVRSTLSRRVRGVLSPYRERGIRRLRASMWGGIPAYAGMTAQGAPFCASVGGGRD